MAKLSPVDYDPFAATPTLTPVDHNPFVSDAPSEADQHLAHPTVDDMLRPQRKPVGGRAGAFARGATRGVIPTGTAAMGAATGAEIGAMTGPFAEIGVPAGALIGGGLGYWAGQKAQKSVMDAVPKGALQVMGQDPASVKLDQQTYPVTSAISEAAPSLIAGGALQRGLTRPELADKAMFTAYSQGPLSTPTRGALIDATREAADRQGVKLPTTLTSLPGYRASRLLPGLGSGAIDTAEKAAPQSVGSKASELAAKYGMPTEPGAVGEKVQDAAGRWAEAQRLKGGDLFEQANAQGAGIKIPPTQTMAYIDSTIADLSANPLTNEPAIKMLSRLKGDLSNPDNPLDLKSLRNLRSSLYNSTPDGLTPNYKAKVAGDLWTRMSGDIDAGLNSAADEGNATAASALSAFKQGNEVWAQRQATLKGTLSKILGSDVREDLSDPMTSMFVADKPPEEAAAAITKLVGSDRRGIRTLMNTLDPDAQDTVRASVIASLGQDSKGGFSASQFLSQMHDIPAETRDLVFGAKNAAAMGDLETILKNVGQAKGRSHSWGSLGAEMAIPAMLGFSHSGGLGAGEGILAMAGVNSVAAHFLSRPDTLRWVTRLARASQKGTDAVGPVLNRLADAAKSSPVLASLHSAVSQAMTNVQNPPQKPIEAHGGFDPSRMTDEELKAAGGAPEPSEHAAQPSDESRVAMIDSMTPKEAMALTIAGEASSDPHEMAGVGHVMANRLASGKYGSTMADILKPAEFNVWENPEALARLKGTPKYEAALQIAEQVLSGTHADITNHATKYYAPRALAELHKTQSEKYPHERPEWAQGDGTALGESVFYP